MRRFNENNATLPDEVLSEVWRVQDNIAFLGTVATYETVEDVINLIDMLEEYASDLSDMLYDYRMTECKRVNESLFQEIQSNYKAMEKEFNEKCPGKDFNKCLDKFASIKDNKDDKFYTDIQYNEDLWNEFLEYCNEGRKPRRVSESYMKDCVTDVDVIIELEGGELIIEDVEDWVRLKAIAGTLAQSQGFYGRLLRDMRDAENEYGGKENLPYPLSL